MQFDHRAANPGGGYYPTYGLGGPSSVISDQVARVIQDVVGPVEQFMPSADVNKVPYLSMVTTGNKDRLALLDAPRERVIIETDFAAKAAPLFELVELRRIEPGERSVVFSFISIGNSPFVETAALVPPPKGQISLSEMTVQTNRFAHSASIEWIALTKTNEGKLQWSLLQKQQATGAVVCLAAIIIGGFIANVPPVLPFGVEAVSHMRYSDKVSFESTVKFVVGCFGAFHKKDGLSYILQLADMQKSARDIKGSFSNMLVDEGATYPLARLYNNSLLEGPKEMKSISEIRVVTEKLFGTRITEVGALQLAPGEEPRPPFRTEAKIPEFMLVHVPDNRENVRIRCYNRQYDIEEEVKIPTHDSENKAVEKGWYIIIRPSSWETGSGMMISDKKPVLYLSEMITKVGFNVNQLSLTEHSAFFAGMAVPYKDGLLGIPHPSVIARKKGDGTTFHTPVDGQAHESGDLYDTSKDCLMFRLNGEIDDPRKYPILAPSGKFPPGVSDSLPEVKFDNATLARRIRDHTMPIVKAASISGSEDTRLFPFMLLDCYKIFKRENGAAPWVVEHDVPGNSKWGPYEDRMLSKMGVHLR